MISKYQAQLEKSPQKLATKRKTAHRVKIPKINKQRGVRTLRRQADHPLFLSSRILYQEPPSSSNNIHSRPNRDEGPVQQPEMVSPFQRFKSIYIVLSLAWKEHGICRSTIHSLFVPPRKGTLRAQHYKSHIDAKVPGKRNSYRENHADSHFLFARVAYRQELPSKFSDEITVFQCRRHEQDKGWASCC